MLRFPLGAKSWERQPKESPQAFEAFQAYIQVKDEGTGGIREVARRLGKSATIIGRWSDRNRWQERYRAYQNHQLILQEREQQTAIREQARAWAGRRIDIREQGFTTGQALLERAMNLLRLPVFDKVVEKKVTTASGEEVDTVTVLNFQQSPRDARLMAETGLKLMRLSADMSTENFGLPSDVNLDDMSDEEVDAYIAQLSELRKQALGGEE